MTMQLGMVGLGRMGANMVRRLLRAGHECVAFDRSPDAVATLVAEGANGADSLAALVVQLRPPRAIFLMIPAGYVAATIQELVPLLAPGDTVIDGGNSNYQDDITRAQQLAHVGIDYVDVGTSGGVWGLERGYCLMIGGEAAAVTRLEPLFAALAPGRGDIVRTDGRQQPNTAEQGYLHCGPAGAGHFVKMVHNGIEYGLMAAYAEGFNILKNAGLGRAAPGEHDAETTPLRHPEHYQYDFNLADIAELWRRGSVITSWLLDLSAQALHADPTLQRFGGAVADSGEGRWTVAAANDLGVPAHVLTAALFERFASRDLDQFQNQVLSAMRFGFGGHQEKK
jgi:6-phosphogluconate dehydrogenase